MSKRIAVILGTGPGLSASLARALSPTHSLLLLSRSLPESLPKLHLNLPEEKVCAFKSDGSRETIDEAFEEAKKRWPEAIFDVGIFNTGGGYSPGNFLDKKEEDLRNSLESGVIAAFNFAQVLIPHFQSNQPDSNTGAKGNLIFTGATMAIRGGPKFSANAPGSFARRGLSQSLAREFGPQAIHVSHVIVDGIINTERIKGMMGEGDKEKRMDPDEMAKTYLALIAQQKSAWTQEMDLRPYTESF